VLYRLPFANANKSGSKGLTMHSNTSPKNYIRATRCNFDINGKVISIKPSNLTLERAKDFVDETQ